MTLRANLMLALNLAFVIFSLVWLVGHSTVRVFDGEFWFALAYLVLAGVNALYFLRKRR